MRLALATRRRSFELDRGVLGSLTVSCTSREASMVTASPSAPIAARRLRPPGSQPPSTLHASRPTPQRSPETRAPSPGAGRAVQVAFRDSCPPTLADRPSVRSPTSLHCLRAVIARPLHCASDASPRLAPACRRVVHRPAKARAKRRRRRPLPPPSLHHRRPNAMPRQPDRSLPLRRVSAWPAGR